MDTHLLLECRFPGNRNFLWLVQYLHVAGVKEIIGWAGPRYVSDELGLLVLEWADEVGRLFDPLHVLCWLWGRQPAESNSLETASVQPATSLLIPVVGLLTWNLD